MMVKMTTHLFKTRCKSLLNIFTVSEAVVQVGRVVLPRWRACEQKLAAVVGEGLGGSHCRQVLLLLLEKLAVVAEIFLPRCRCWCHLRVLAPSFGGDQTCNWPARECWKTGSKMRTRREREGSTGYYGNLDDPASQDEMGLLRTMRRTERKERRRTATPTLTSNTIKGDEVSGELTASTLLVLGWSFSVALLWTLNSDFRKMRIVTWSCRRRRGRRGRQGICWLGESRRAPKAPERSGDAPGWRRVGRSTPKGLRRP